MKKFIVIPDSFKGTMSSMTVSKIMKDAILSIYKDASVITIPIADGGEGTVDAVLESIKESVKVSVKTLNPFNEKIEAYYAVYKDTAIIEMASAAGIGFAEGRLDPSKTTTYGVGLIIKDAIKNGAKNIILGLGGSATNDCGVGMAQALGTKFLNKDGFEFTPQPLTLDKIMKIDNFETKKLLDGIKVTAMCDITNPLYGKSGAAYIFSPQKGADPQMVKKLDDNLVAISKVINTSLGCDVSLLPGSGAAGGMGAAVVGFLNGELKSGINTLLDLVSFDEIITNSDIIFTGEGKIDSQSVDGKVISGIALRAKALSIPVVCVCGAIGDVPDSIYDMGVKAIFSINKEAIDYSISRYQSENNLRIAMNNIVRLIKMTKGGN